MPGSIFPITLIDSWNLDGVDGFKVYGEAVNNQLGYSVSFAGDMNDDGYDDFIIGTLNAEASYVIFGKIGGWESSLDLSSLDGTNGFKITGEVAGDKSGFSVSGVGDINGDGFDDLVIGAPLADPNEKNDAGSSYVIFGHNETWPSVLALSLLNGITGFKINGESAGDQSGFSVSRAGDVNGDGLNDLIIGAPYADAAGSSYVIFGYDETWPSVLELSSLNGTIGFKINGEAAGDQSGFSVSDAGDVNGDGIDDLIIGASYADPNEKNDAGSSYVIFGYNGTWPSVFELSSLNGATGFKMNGEVSRDRSGVSVSGVGDINGDGIDDIIIGARGAEYNGRGAAGTSYVIFGHTDDWITPLELSTLDGTNGFKVHGEVGGDNSGCSVSAGDINGDGFNDLIIGARLGFFKDIATGTSYVIFGHADNWASDLDLLDLDGYNGFKIGGENKLGESGYAVSFAGDINGDGYSDFIIGAPGEESPGGQYKAGASYIILGNTLKPLLSGSDGSISYVENDLIVIDSQISVIRSVSHTLIYATVSITHNFNAAQDVLVFADKDEIIGLYNDLTGVLTFIGVSSTSNYEIALRDVQYHNLSDDPTHDTRTISFVVNDGGANSTAVTRNINIIPVNDAPALISSSENTVYLENSSKQPIDDAIVIIDPDSANLAGARISITFNFNPFQDVLHFSEQNGIAGYYNSMLGALTLIGDASVENYQTALRSITYENISDSPTTSPRTVSFTVNDGQSDSLSITRQIDIVSVNDVPILTGSEGDLTYTENGVAIIINPGVTISDDNTQLTNATVAITNHFEPDQDILKFINQNGISGNYNNVTGTLTLAGMASVSDYQTALRTVRYENLSDDPTTNTRTITFTVNDGSIDSNAITRDINIIAVNDMPVLTGSSTTISYAENDGAKIIDPNIVITDVDNTGLVSATISITYNFNPFQDVLHFSDQSNIVGYYHSMAGALTLFGSANLEDYQTALRSITYENLSDNPTTSSRTISFTVNDGQSNSIAITRQINITPVNDAPVLSGSDSDLTYTENDSATVIDSSITITDDNTDLISATVAIMNNFNTVQDVLHFTDQSGISGSYSSITGILTLTGTASLTKYQTMLRTVTYKNLSDDPTTNARTISFKVNDGITESNTITRKINIIAVNDLPELTGSGGSLNYTENNPAQIIDPSITISDIDNVELASAKTSITRNFNSGQDVLNFVNQANIVGFYNNAMGVLDLVGYSSLANYQVALRTITYENLSDNPTPFPRTISFIVNDGMGDSAAIMRDINIIRQNDLPTISGSGASLDYTENDSPKTLDPDLTITSIDDSVLVSATISITENFNPDQDVLLFTNQNDITGNFNSETGVLTLAGASNVFYYQTALRTIKYHNLSDDPATTPRTISFTVNDGQGHSNTFTKTIYVTSINDAPVLINNRLTITEGQTVMLTSNVLGAMDADNNDDDLIFTVSNIQHGQFWSNSTSAVTNQFVQSDITQGNIQFIHDGSNTAPAYSVLVSDGNSISAVLPADIDFTAVNDSPVIENNKLNIDQGQSTFVTTTDLSATDEETQKEDLLFKMSNIERGYFENKNTPETPITSFYQRDIMNNEIRFVHDGSSIAPRYRVTVSDGEMNSTSISSVAVNFVKGQVNISQSVEDTSVRDKIIGGVVGGVVSLLFFAIRIYLNHKAEQSFKKMSQEYQTSTMKQQADFQRNVMRPISKAIFDRVNIRGFFGYINDETMKCYLDAVMKIIDNVEKEGIDVDLEHMSVVDQSRLVGEIAKQTRRQFIPDYACCSCGNLSHYLKSFCVSDVSPEELEEQAETIALTVKEELQHRKSEVKKSDAGVEGSDIDDVKIEMAEGVANHIKDDHQDDHQEDQKAHQPAIELQEFKEYSFARPFSLFTKPKEGDEKKQISDIPQEEVKSKDLPLSRQLSSPN